MFLGHISAMFQRVIYTSEVCNFVIRYLERLNCAIKTVRIASFIDNKSMLKSSIETAKVGSLSDDNLVPSKVPVIEPLIRFGIIFTQRPIKTAKVCSLFKKTPKVLKKGL